MGDIICRLYLCSEALEKLALLLHENEGGLAHILGTLGRDLNNCAAQLDDVNHPENLSAPKCGEQADYFGRA